MHPNGLKRKFTGATSLEDVTVSQKQNYMLGGESEGPVQRLNPVLTGLKEVLTSLQTPASVGSDYESAAEMLELLSVKAEQLYCDQTHSLRTKPSWKFCVHKPQSEWHRLMSNPH